MRGRVQCSGISGHKALFLAALMLIMTQVNYIGNSPENMGLEVEEEPKFTGIATVDQLFSGDAHSCAFNSIGSLKCWGNGSSGQLGIGSSESMGDESDEMSSNLPFVDLGTGLYPTSMALGNSHSCAIFVNGSLKCWGEMKYLGLGFSDSGGFGDGYGETGDNLPFVSLPSGLNVTSISAGHHHTCAVFNDSNMTCWGENSAGQLGIGNQNFIGDGANEMGDNLDMIDKPTGKNVSKMALGMEHTCVIWDDGSVSCWGENQYGQLGIGSSTDVGTDSSHMGNSLATVSLPSGTIAVDITAGSEFTCVLLDDNSVRCWGKNDRGQLGIGSTATKGTSSAHMGNSLGSVDFDDGFTSRYAVALDAGTESVCVILDNSDVKCWGANSFGQLGIGNVNDELDQFGEIGSLNDVSLGAGKTAKSLQVGNKFACAKLNDDNLKCWGSASEGRLGYENTETRGDSSADMGTNLPVVDLGLDGELGEVDCDQMFDPIHDSFHSSTVESNADVGMNNSITLRQNGCPAIAYINQDSDNMMFAVYFNGFWTLEQPTSSGGVVVDTHITFDSVGNPHIVHVEEADSADEIFYTTKVGGRWTTAQLPGFGSSIILMIDSNDDLEIVFANNTKIQSLYCTATKDCSAPASWIENLDVSENQVTNLDGAIDNNDKVHISYIDENGASDDVKYLSFAIAGAASTPAIINNSGHLSTTDSSIALDVGVNGSIHIAHFSDLLGNIYSVCHVSCTSDVNWLSSSISGIDTPDFDLAVASDLVPYVIGNDGTSLKAVTIADGSWTDHGSFGSNTDWVSISIDRSGRLWVASHPNLAQELWAYDMKGFAGTGMLIDADGDGWTGIDEVRCETDYLDDSSVPSDSDFDGICDRFDTKNDLPVVGESNVISLGNGFGCSILQNRSVSCWGTNSVKQLGNSTAGASSNEGVIVDLPDGFEAIDIDAGASHACALEIEGEVYCWGDNNEGQLGRGTNTNSETPGIVTLPDDVRVLGVSASEKHTCAVTNVGGVYCWGNGSDGQTGEYFLNDASGKTEQDFESGLDSYWYNDKTTPWTIDSTDASNGSKSLKSNNHGSNTLSSIYISVPTVDGNISFQFKTDSESNRDYLRFYIDDILQDQWSGLSNSWVNHTSQFSAGIHTFRWTYSKDASDSAVTGDTVKIDNITINTGTILASGGSTSTPRQLVFPADAGFIEEISTGSRHSCGFSNIGKIYCWGYNGGVNEMVLGNSTTIAANSSTPVFVNHLGEGGIGVSNPEYVAGAISSGKDITCALPKDANDATRGHGRCWGQGTDGDLMLGNSTASLNGTRIDVEDLSSDILRSISVGESHACAVVNSAIKCWGREVSGELGDGGTATSTSQVPVDVDMPAGYSALEVEVGEKNTCALFKVDADDSRRVLCWGESDDGRNGESTASDRNAPDSSKPVEIDEPLEPYSSSQDVAINYYRVAEISAGTNFYCARSIQGLVKCWGENDAGQLGLGNSTQYGDSQDEMGEALPFVNFGSNLTAIQIDSGIKHTCALLTDGSVRCWGYNGYGQLGAGNSQNYGDTWAKTGDGLVTVNLDGGKVTKIAAGAQHTCALLDDGEVKCWGANYRGQLGIGSSSTKGTSSWHMGSNLASVDFGDSLKAIDISAGHDHTCAILENAMLKCWGDAYSGTLGVSNNNAVGTSSSHMGTNLAYINLGTERASIKISAGQSYSCVLRDDGTIVCWGDNTQGRLGIGNTNTIGDSTGSPWSSEMGDSLVHVDMGKRDDSLTDINFIDVKSAQSSDYYYTSATSNNYYQSSGEAHTCAITDGKDLGCWGSNQRGQLGIETSNARGDSTSELGSNFIMTNIGGKVESLELGYYSTCAIRVDGEVRCWGDNSHGQLGHGDTVRRGDGSNEMGENLPATNLWMQPADTDGDGTLDVWDTDDDNDLVLDQNDDFPFDECASKDTDNDRMPDDLVNSCSTELIEDIDDDNDNWYDTNESLCKTNPLDATHVPLDTDGDWSCDYLDSDDDGDSVPDLQEHLCEPYYDYSKFNPLGGSGLYNLHPSYGAALSYNQYNLRLVGSRESSSYYSRIWTYDEPTYSSVAAWLGNEYLYYPVTAHFEGVDYYAGSTNKVYSLLPTDSSGSSSVHMTLSHTSNERDISIAPNGTVYVIDYDGIAFKTTSGEIGEISYPTGAKSGYGKVAIDENGLLHFFNTKNTGGFYYWTYDSSGAGWSSEEFIVSNSGNYAGYKRAKLSVDDDGVPHLAFIAGTSSNSVLLYYNRTGGVWTKQFEDTSASYHIGVDMAVNSTGTVSIGWIDQANNTLLMSHNRDSGIWRTDTLDDKSSTWSTSHVTTISVALDNGDDPFIFALRDFGGSSANSMIYYTGKFPDPARESTDQPPDADGDGICDVRDQAVLDYGFTELLFENNTQTSFTPEFTGMLPTGVTIEPALPNGLQLNSATGEIYGTPTQVDYIGSSYFVNTTSSNDDWSTILTLRIVEEAPLLSGYDSYASLGVSSSYAGSTGYYGNKLIHADDGTTFYASRYFGHSGSSSPFSGISVSVHDSDDIYVAKRNWNGEWLWARTIRMCFGEVVDIDMDSSGNVYVNANFDSLAVNSNCDVMFSEHPNFNFVSKNSRDTMVAKYDPLGNLEWVQHSSTDDADTGFREVYTERDGMHVQQNGEVVLAGKILTIADQLMFGDMTFDSVTNCTSSEHPFVLKINATGHTQWTSIAQSNQSSCPTIGTIRTIGHSDGSTTIVGSTNHELQFGSNIVQNEIGLSTTFGFIAHSNSTGDWEWSKSITMSSATNSVWSINSPLISPLSDGSMVVAISPSNTGGSGATLNLAGESTFQPDNHYWFAAARIQTDGSKVWTYYNDMQRGMGSVSDMTQVVDSDDNTHYLLDTESTTPGYFSMFGITPDGHELYYQSTSGGSSSNFIYDMGINNDGRIFFVAEANSQRWFGKTTVTSFGNSGQDMSSSSAREYYIFGNVGHTASTHPPIVNVTRDLPAIGEGNYVTWEISPDLPDGLTFDSITGEISGEHNKTSVNATYLINATVSSPVQRTYQTSITFGVIDKPPNAFYNNSNLVLHRGQQMQNYGPEIVNESHLLSYYSLMPQQLPSGLNFDSTTGIFSGTPSVNASIKYFVVHACNQWGVCDDGSSVQITVLEQVPNISYPSAIYNFTKDMPINPIPPINQGGMVETWEIEPNLPVGLSMNSHGVLSGVAINNQEGTNYTIWANNSGGSDSFTINITVSGTGIHIFYPYDNHVVAVNYSIGPQFPSRSGATVINWSISPELPSGMQFGGLNGTIWGTPNIELTATEFTVTGYGLEVNGTTIITIAVLSDYDKDGIPDLTDDDDDDDGWDDVVETACGSDSKDSDDYPNDTDADGTCDANDDFSDLPIILLYPAESLELSLNVEMDEHIPNVGGGDILTWEIYPALPQGMEFSGISPARSSSHNGTISGNPNELSDPLTYTIWANNSQYQSSFSILISILNDTDLDGTPDVYDPDDDGDDWTDELEEYCSTDPLDVNSVPTDLDNNSICDQVEDQDGDGWTDELETICNTNASDPNDTPIDTDGDGVCNHIDDDDDDDSFIDSEELQCKSNPKDNLSIPVDADQNGVCDGLDLDTDGDTWADGAETVCNTDPFSVTDFPVDTDGDGACDVIDEDDDNDLWTDLMESICSTDSKDATNLPSDFDNDKVCDFIDADDDGDTWIDQIEIDCDSDPFNLSNTPSNIDGDLLCDSLDDDMDGDGTANNLDHYPTNPAADADTDNDGQPNRILVTNYVGELIEDLDDDGDTWSDVVEGECGTDPLDKYSFPMDIDSDGICDARDQYIQSDSGENTPGESDDSDETESLDIPWWVCSLMLIVFMLLVPIVFYIRERIRPELEPLPEFTVSSPDFKSGSGLMKDPYVCEPMEVYPGETISSKERITISNLEPDSVISFSDVFSEINQSRFDLDDIIVSEEGNLTFNLNFDGDDDIGWEAKECEGLIRAGTATVYFSWSVTIVDPDEEVIEGSEEGEEMDEDSEEEEESDEDSKEEEEMDEDSEEEEEPDEDSEEEEEPDEDSGEEEFDEELEQAEEELRIAEEELRKAEEELESRENLDSDNEEAEVEADDDDTTEEEETELVDDAAENDSELEAELEAERKATKKAEKKMAQEKKAREKTEKLIAEERKAREDAEAKAEDERLAREEAEAKAEEERKAKEEADRNAKAEAEKKAKEEAEAKAEEERIAREEAEAEAEKQRKARQEAEAKAEEERKAREEAEKLAREEAEKLARAEAEKKAKEEAERKAAAEQKAEAEKKAKEEAEAKAEAERIAREEAEAKAEAERIAREEAEARAEAERIAREEAERKAEEEARRKAEEEERRAREEEERKAREEEERLAKEEEERKTRETASMLAAKAFMSPSQKTKQQEVKKRIDDANLKAKDIETELIRISKRSGDIDFEKIGTAKDGEKDALQRINGIGPFLEQKLNALGIFTLEQIAKLTPDVVEQVNEAIEFFPGRIKRDRWMTQAQGLIKRDAEKYAKKIPLNKEEF